MAARVDEAGVDNGTPAVPNRSLLEAEIIGLAVRFEELADDAHSAVFAAHGTGRGFGFPVLTDLFEFIRVDDELLLGRPIELLARPGQGEVPPGGALDSLDDV